MTRSTFEIVLNCACGRIVPAMATLVRPGGVAPISCTCGRSFVLQQLDPAEVTRLIVDPTGITNGEIPDTVKLPKVH